MRNFETWTVIFCYNYQRIVNIITVNLLEELLI